MIRLDGVSKQFENAKDASVRDVSLDVESNSLLVLLGESGCGKTTTLKMINRLVEPTSGAIFVDGQDVRELEPIALRRSIGYVFQGIGLFPHLDVAANIAVVPQLERWPAERIDARIDALLTMLGLPPDEYRQRLPHELSGGQRQRVGVARALAAEPGILLMDEPFAALDPLTREELQHEIKTLQRTLGLTIVLVTHDVNEALLLADRIAVMRDGALLALDTPAGLLGDPPDDYIARIMAMPGRQAERYARLVETNRGR